MRRSLVLLAVILLCFCFSVLRPADPPPLAAADLDRCANDLVQDLAQQGEVITKTEAEAYVKEAHCIASALFAGQPQACAEFRDTILQTFVDTAGADAVILYNPGGWGRMGMDKDGQWAPVVVQAEALLEERGYNTVTQTFLRTSSTFFGVLEEFQELLFCFPTKAREQADLVTFLTENRPEVQVVITGLSQGGAYTNEVSKLLESNERVCSIAAGVPFYYLESVSNNTLVLDNNGVEADALKDGDATALLSCTVSAYRSWLWNGLDGGPLGVGAYYNPPGHDYHWEEPGVGPIVTGFLRYHFPSQTS
jgi:hypothetical protein